MRTLMTGIAFGESPRWAPDKRLWFADWGTREIIAVEVGEGATVQGGVTKEANRDVMIRFPPAPFEPISFDFLPDGRPVIVSTSQGGLLRREADGSLVTHANLAQFADFGFNEIVIDGRGHTYVNGANFNAMEGHDVIPGIIVLATADGAARQVAEGIAFPNGMAITPDNATLIIAESHGRCLTAFDIAADGSLSNRRVWADLGEGTPDGICIDTEAAVWYADVPNKRCVRVREGGEVLQTIDLDRGAFACILGGADRRTLFMVIREWRGFDSAADDSRTGQLLSIRAPAPGAGWP